MKKYWESLSYNTRNWIASVSIFPVMVSTIIIGHMFITWTIDPVLYEWGFWRLVFFFEIIISILSRFAMRY
jgi:hypothetical protein